MAAKVTFKFGLFIQIIITKGTNWQKLNFRHRAPDSSTLDNTTHDVNKTQIDYVTLHKFDRIIYLNNRPALLLKGMQSCQGCVKLMLGKALI